MGSNTKELFHTYSKIDKQWLTLEDTTSQLDNEYCIIN